jgi:hypothetical protein
MASQPPRYVISAPASRRQSSQLVQLRCEPLEERNAPALFNVASPISFSGAKNFGCVATADLNKDGLMDAVLTDFGTGYGSPSQPLTTPGNSITVMYGQAGGSFSKVTLNTGGENVSFVSIGDINADGWMDLVASNANRQNTGSISVFQNNAQSGFSNALTRVGSPFSTFSNNVSWVGLADMTGDNILDVVAGSFGKDDGTGNNIVGNNITIFQGNGTSGKGNFTFATNPTTTLNPVIQFIPTALAIADFDGDGIKDIAAAVPSVPPDYNQPQQNATAYVFRGTGAGGFASAFDQYDTGGVLPVNIQAADVNGDGKPELIVANAGDPQDNPEFKGNSVGIVYNVSSVGNLSFGQTQSITASSYGTFAVAVHDYNLDNKVDIAAINYGAQLNPTPSAFVSIYLGNGAGTFTPDTSTANGMYSTTPGIGGGQYLAVGDFDGNGTPDLITAHASSKVTVMNNTTPIVQSVTVNSGQTDTTQRSRVTTLTVTFNRQVNVTAGAFSMSGVSISGSTLTGVTVAHTTSNATGVTVATLTFSGTNTDAGSLADGKWTLTVDKTKVDSSGTFMGANYASSGIYRLFGDINGDRAVDTADLFAFRQSFGKVSGDTAYNMAFDFNNDGSVDTSDLFQFRLRFGQVLPP